MPVECLMCVTLSSNISQEFTHLNLITTNETDTVINVILQTETLRHTEVTAKSRYKED